MISVAANVACLLGAMIYPYMPTIGKQIWIEQCDLPESQMSFVQIIKNEFRVKRLLPDGHRIGKVSHICILYIFRVVNRHK